MLLAVFSACSAVGEGTRHSECSTSISLVKQLPCHDSSPGKLCGGLAQQYAASLCTVVGIAAQSSGSIIPQASPRALAASVCTSTGVVGSQVVPLLCSLAIYESTSKQECQARRMHMLDLQDFESSGRV